MAASDRGDELVQLRRQLVAVQAELQAFTYSVSHDLRAPLRHINAYAQIIAEDWPGMPTDAASHLATIRQSAQLLAAQLDGLTQLSRQSVKPISLQPVAVSALARRLAETLSAKQPGLAVQWQLAPDVPWVLADDAAPIVQSLCCVLWSR